MHVTRTSTTVLNVFVYSGCSLFTYTEVLHNIALCINQKYRGFWKVITYRHRQDTDNQTTNIVVDGDVLIGKRVSNI